MNLYEFEGKALLFRAGVPTPVGAFASDVEGAAKAAADVVGYPCVVKSQVLTGGRGKAGGIAIVTDETELRAAAERILALEIKGERPTGVLIEGRVPEGRELYAAIAFDTSRACPVILFSSTGGIEVESNADHLVRVPVPVAELDDVTPAWVADALVEAERSGTYAKGIGTLDDDVLGAASRLLANLLRVFREHDLELLEINPLIWTADGLVAADAKVTVDDDALFRQGEILAIAARPALAELDARAKEHGLNFVDLEGEVCIMGNGAGLCMSLLDAVAAFGSSAANFLDTGGGASTSKAYEGMRILQDRSQGDPAVRSHLIMLSLAITRAREAAEGIAQSHLEHGTDVPTFAVVHGTGAEEGVRILEEAGIHVAPDIRTAVELAATAERGI